MCVYVCIHTYLEQLGHSVIIIVVIVLEIFAGLAACVLRRSTISCIYNVHLHEHTVGMHISS